MKTKIKFAAAILTNNFWLKLFALITAIFVWVYCNGAILKGIRL